MDFYQMLKERNLLDTITSPDFIAPEFSKSGVVEAWLTDVIVTNKKALILRDPDPDGALSGMIMELTFKHLGYTNFESFKYASRSHKIDISSLFYAVSNKFDAILIFDAGSQEPHVVSRMRAMGLEVLIIDHHQSSYNYEDFDCTMLNTAIENRFQPLKTYLSAAAVVYVVCERLIRSFSKNEPQSLAPLALCSLYADSMDMADRLNRSIYRKASMIPTTNLPHLVQHFMEDYQGFTKRFITFLLNPKMNALFRGEEFDLLNSLLEWHPMSTTPIDDVVKSIVETHKFYSQETDKAADIIKHEVLDTFVVANLSSVAKHVKIHKDLLPNYTGIVANKLAQKYGKVAVVMSDTGHDLKGSLRDILGRNFLEVFKRFCNANGHNAAFGINLKYNEFQDFLSYLRLVDSQGSKHSLSNEPIVVMGNTDKVNPDLLEHMAIYNEFSGGSAPVALIQKVLFDTKSHTKNFFYHEYKWGSFTIKSKNLIVPGSRLLLQPTRSFSKFKGYITHLHVVDKR
jgi:single-stranded DNA-specific DHH superfamily exonuclease